MAVENVKQNADEFFIKYGNKMHVDGNTLIYIGNNKWNSGYSNGFSLNDNTVEIEIEITKLSISYGCVIGIVSSPKYVNDYYHFNKFDVTSYALKSDSSQFCGGKKVGKNGNKFKSGDIITISMSSDALQWFVNRNLQCTQKHIDKQVECWYFGIAMLGKNDCIKIVKCINHSLKVQH